MGIHNRPLRLNVGCGRKRLNGYVNIDVVSRSGAEPDIVCDFTKSPIPLDDECASEVLAVHVFEHFFPWECEALLADWHRLLMPGGKLALEMPDIVKCARNLVASSPDNISYWGIYGDPRHRDPFMMHKWGWTFATIKPLLVSNGFGNVKEKQTVFHRCGKVHRDFRVEAWKR